MFVTTSVAGILGIAGVSAIAGAIAGDYLRRRLTNIWEHRFRTDSGRMSSVRDGERRKTPTKRKEKISLKEFHANRADATNS